LADHFHYWVASGWLEAGSPADALEVLGCVPDDTAKVSERIRTLRQQVLDAIEADAIGDSVYPPWVPVEERWTAPRCLPPRKNDAGLQHWFPGRIVNADQHNVRLVYAHRIDDREYETHVIDVPGDKWEGEWKLGSSSEAAGYVELGVYADGSQLVVEVQAEDRRRTADLPADLPLSYFDRWHFPTVST
jgi:hypothetical protein